MAIIIEARRCVQSLRCTTCPACGRFKNPGMSLCRTQYHILPPELRKALYCRIGEGYESAMTDALTFLKVEFFVDPPVKTCK